MRQALLVSVAALALAAGSTVALSQGGGGSPGGAAGGANAPMANPSGPGGGAPSGSMSKDSQSTIDTQRGAQERTGKDGKQQKSTQGKDQPATQQRQQTQSPTQQRQTESPAQPGGKQGQAQQGGKQSGERPMASSNVSLTSEQKTVIRSKVLTSAAPRVTNVNFDIRVGTVVPRTVRVAPVPVTLVEIEPTWRGYMYFVYSDEIIIVEPRTLRIVAVLEV